MAAPVQVVDSLDDIVQKSADTLATFIKKVEGQRKMILVPNDIIGIELGKRSKDGVFRRFLSSMQEVFVSSPCVVVAAASNPPGSSEYARVTANINPPAIEKLSESDYNMYREELVTASQAKPQVNPYSTLSEAIWSITEHFSKASAGTNNATTHYSWLLRKKKTRYFDIVIFSSHGIFSHEKRYCSSKDQANSILHQVRDMEKEILECTKQITPSITPRIYIVTQLLPGVVQTTKPYLLKKLKSAKKAHVVQVTFKDNKGIFCKRTESEMMALAKDIKEVTDEVLQRWPIMIIGSDRDGNQRASLLAKDIGATQISGDKATEASWRGGARKFLLPVKKIPKH